MSFTGMILTGVVVVLVVLVIAGIAGFPDEGSF